MKPPVKYGLMAGAAIIGFYLFVYLSGRQFTGVGMMSRVIGLGIILPFIILAVASRKKELGGFIGVRESLKAGLGTTLVIAVVLAVFNYFFFKTELGPVYKKKSLEFVVLNKLKRDEAEKTMKETYYYIEPFSQAINTLMWTMIAGGIMSLAVGTMMAKKRDEA